MSNLLTPLAPCNRLPCPAPRIPLCSTCASGAPPTADTPLSARQSHATGFAPRRVGHSASSRRPLYRRGIGSGKVFIQIYFGGEIVPFLFLVGARCFDAFSRTFRVQPLCYDSA